MRAPGWLKNGPPGAAQEFVMLLASPASPADAAARLLQALAAERVAVAARHVLRERALALHVHAEAEQVWLIFRGLLTEAAGNDFDIAVAPARRRKKRLLLCDMDSTIVRGETLDEIAAEAGIGPAFGQITARAMRGELDFCEALRERVKLLRGLPAEALSRAAAGVRFNPGARALIRQAGRAGLRTVLVSGGFEPVVSDVAARLGFDHYVCNRMQIRDAKLTGRVQGPVVDGQAKLAVLRQECRQLGIGPERACCVGDGANDLPMLTAAGLGVGYKAKPLLRATLPYQINVSGLDFLLDIMGIGA